MTSFRKREAPLERSSGELSAASRRLLIIFNPAAGRKPERRLNAVVKHLAALGCKVTVRATTARGDAAQLARAATTDEFDLIVAAGGDGTINEVANGIADSGLPLGIVPLGTGNVLANEVGLPHGAKALARLLAHGTARPIWPGEIDGHRFLMMAGAGFDAAVLERLDEGWKQRVGKLAFVWAILRAIAVQRPSRFVVECAGERLEAASLVIAKGHFYAGRFVLARAARLEDPHLHLVLFGNGRRRDAVRYLLAMALGILDRLSDIRILAVDSAALLGPQGAPIEADGDIVAQAPARIGIAAEPLQLVQAG